MNLRRILIIGAGIAGLAIVGVAIAKSAVKDVLRAALRSAIETDLASRGKFNITAAGLLQQYATGVKTVPGLTVTQAESDYLQQWARNISDILAGLPLEYPDVGTPIVMRPDVLDLVHNALATTLDYSGASNVGPISLRAGAVPTGGTSMFLGQMMAGTRTIPGVKFTFGELTYLAQWYQDTKQAIVGVPSIYAGVGGY